jgi:hypothetical protein
LKKLWPLKSTKLRYLKIEALKASNINKYTSQNDHAYSLNANPAQNRGFADLI